MKLVSVCLIALLLAQPAHARERKHRVFDKKFVAVAAITLGTSLLTTKAIHNCRRRVGVERCDGGYGEFAAREGVRFGFNALLVGVSYWLKKQDAETGAEHSLWWTIPAGGMAWNLATAKKQSSTKRVCPTGTVCSLD